LKQNGNNIYRYQQLSERNKREKIQIGITGTAKEAKYVEGRPSTTSAWAGWSRFDIPENRYGGVHSLLICTSSPLGFPTCHRAG
jgi:hypothetical protein